MAKPTPKELEGKFERLPQELRDAIAAEATANAVFEIGKRNGLTIDKIGKLSTQMAYVFLGLIHPKDFVRDMKEALEIDLASAQKIADDINREIFYPVREHLRNLHNSPGEFPKPKLDTPASIFAEKMAGVSREPIKEVQVTEKLKIPEIKAKDSFAELRAELQREIESERGGETGVRLPEKKTAEAHLDVGRPSPRPAPLADVTEQRPSKPFALDTKESPPLTAIKPPAAALTPPLPTPFRVSLPDRQAGTPTSPPASVRATIPPFKPSAPPPQTSTLPSTSAGIIKNDGLLPAFRGYKMSGQPMQTTKPTGSPMSQDMPQPLTSPAPVAPRAPASPQSPQAPKPIPPAAQHGPDPYREPAT